MAGIAKFDAWEKVSGQAVYAGDLKFPGLLAGAVLRSEVAHARIRRVDVSAALALPGVAAAVTGADFPPVRTGTVVADETVMAREKVRYIGEPVAAVAACDPATARRALALIRVDMEELPGVFTVAQALAAGAPLVHEDAAAYRCPMPLRRYGNVVNHVTVTKGDVDQAWAACDLVVEDTFTVPLVYQAPLEPKAVVARVDAQDRLTVWCGTQSPFGVREGLAESLALPMSRVRVIGVRVGGAFGGKGSAGVEAICALLALKTRRPVKIETSRLEDFYGSTPRHAMQIVLKTGARRDGTLLARQAGILVDTGAYANFGPITVSLATTLVTGPYNIPNLSIEGIAVYTNKISCGACRAPGAPQAHFAAEVQMDRIARELGLDPVAVRRKNALGGGDTTATGQVLADGGFAAVLDRLARAVAEDLRAVPRRAGKARGIGVAACFWGMAGFGSACTARMNEDGTVVLTVGAVETGAGSDTAMAVLAGEELDLPPERIRVVSGDTDTCPYDFGAHGSRTTQAAGTAVLQAVRRLKAGLFQAAAGQLGVPAGDLLMGGGRIYSAREPERSVPLARLASYLSFARGGPVLAAGGNNPPQAAFTGQVDVQSHTAPGSPFYTFGAEGVAVDADAVTGEVEVRRIVAVHDLGKVVYRPGAEGQVQGGAAMGLGYGLCEEAVFHGGRVVNASFLDYRLPTMLDVPAIETVLLEKPSPRVPEDIRGIGEPPVIPTAAAIANAVGDALGVRITALPLTPERVRRAVNEFQKIEEG